MDVNATLAEIRKLANGDPEGWITSHDADRLAELILALDEWLKKGGFLPNDWQH